MVLVKTKSINYNYDDGPPSLYPDEIIMEKRFENFYIR